MDNSSATTGTLYLVPTPIGNLEDITYRAINVLNSVFLIAAEDTRKSGLLLSHYNIKTRTISYHKFNEKSRIDKLLSLLQEGKEIALITDAGTPGISDPAEIIIREAIKQNIRICTLPGATAFLPALVSSGFNCRQFVFIGFLPVKISEKRALLQRLSSYPETIIFYESGQRLFDFLTIVREYFGNRNICIGREISKIFETYYRNKIDYFLENKERVILKGEFTIVCEGEAERVINDAIIVEYLQRYLTAGDSVSTAVNKTSKELNLGKNRVYKLALSSPNNSE